MSPQQITDMVIGLTGLVAAALWLRLALGLRRDLRRNAPPTVEELDDR